MNWTNQKRRKAKVFNDKNYLEIIDASLIWPRYHNAKNLSLVVGLQKQMQWIPSQVSLERAIRQLGLQRTDNKIQRDDVIDAARAAEAAESAAERKAAQFAREPISHDEHALFAGLDQQSLSRHHGTTDADGELFRARYDEAVTIRLRLLFDRKANQHGRPTKRTGKLPT
jgi:hypothetical protein